MPKKKLSARVMKNRMTNLREWLQCNLDMDSDMYFDDVGRVKSDKMLEAVEQLLEPETEQQKHNLIDLAEQQLLGFKQANYGESLTDLVSSMGLSLNELEIIIKLYPNTLSGEDITSIREYLTGET